MSEYAGLSPAEFIELLEKKEATINDTKNELAAAKQTIQHLRAYFNRGRNEGENDNYADFLSKINTSSTQETAVLKSKVVDLQGRLEYAVGVSPVGEIRRLEKEVEQAKTSRDIWRKKFEDLLHKRKNTGSTAVKAQEPVDQAASATSISVAAGSATSPAEAAADSMDTLRLDDK